MIFRALENILESGEPGVHHFANSVYKVGPDDGDHQFDDGHGHGDDSDSYSEEDSEHGADSINFGNNFNDSFNHNKHKKVFTQEFSSHPHRYSSLHSSMVKNRISN